MGYEQELQIAQITSLLRRDLARWPIPSWEIQFLRSNNRCFAERFFECDGMTEKRAGGLESASTQEKTGRCRSPDPVPDRSRGRRDKFRVALQRRKEQAGEVSGGNRNAKNAELAATEEEKMPAGMPALQEPKRKEPGSRPAPRQEPGQAGQVPTGATFQWCGEIGLTLRRRG